jgi:tetratricopeptide (TPR) repeat protein
LADSALAALSGAEKSDIESNTRRVRLLVARGKLSATDAFISGRNLDAALRTLRRADSLSAAIPDSPERADALLQLGFAEYVQTFLSGGEFGPIRERFDAALRISRHLNDPRRVAEALFHVGLIHERLGEKSTARARYVEAMTVAQSCDCLLIESYARRHVGFILLAMERPGDALPYFRRSLELREKVGFTVYLPYANCALADVLVALGRPAEARPYAVRAVDIAASLDAPRAQTVAGLSLAEVHLALGNTTAARREFLRVRDIATEIGYEAGIRAAREGLKQTRER